MLFEDKNVHYPPARLRRNLEQFFSGSNRYLSRTSLQGLWYLLIVVIHSSKFKTIHIIISKISRLFCCRLQLSLGG